MVLIFAGDSTINSFFMALLYSLMSQRTLSLDPLAVKFKSGRLEGLDIRLYEIISKSQMVGAHVLKKGPFRVL